eukprot:10198503-Lingulodinium_polyedra.AAC.1
MSCTPPHGWLVGSQLRSRCIACLLAMSADCSGVDDSLALQGPLGLYCYTCQFWVNGADQWAVRVTGRKHRRNVSLALQPRFTSDQRYWARDVAR